MKGSSTRVIDLEGRTVIPGMIDAHVHLLGLGQGLRNVDLRGTTSYDEVNARVVARARTRLQGAGSLAGHGTRTTGPIRSSTMTNCPRPFPDAPVFPGARRRPRRPRQCRDDDWLARLSSASRTRSAVTSSATPRACGRGSSSTRRWGSWPSRADYRRGLQAATIAATQELNRWGLTSVHDAGVSRDVIDVFESVAQQGKFSVRDHVMISSDDSTLAHCRFRRGPQAGLYDERPLDQVHRDLCRRARVASRRAARGLQ